MEESSTVGLDASASEPVSNTNEDSVTTTTELMDELLLNDSDAPKSTSNKKKKWQDRFVDVDLDAPGGPSPIDTKKNIFSILTYWWTGGILSKGHKRPLSVSKWMLVYFSGRELQFNNLDFKYYTTGLIYFVIRYILQVLNSKFNFRLRMFGTCPVRKIRSKMQQSCNENGTKKCNARRTSKYTNIRTSVLNNTRSNFFFELKDESNLMLMPIKFSFARMK